MMSRALLCALLLIPAGSAVLAQPTAPPPGEPFLPPERHPAAGSPVVFEHSHEAGPDQTFFLVGDRLTDEVIAWGPSADHPGGQEWKPLVQFHTGAYLAATLPEQAPDGPFLIWVKNAAGSSQPIVLNKPEPWWCGPDTVRPGEITRVFGRNLSRRPDFARRFVYLCKPGQQGVWVTKPPQGGKYSLSFAVPDSLAPGSYEVWVHAGQGGAWGWGGPIPLHVRVPEKAQPAPVKLGTEVIGRQLQQALDEAGRRGGGEVHISQGVFTFSGTLQIPAHVKLSGKGSLNTTLQLVSDRTTRFARLGGQGWDQAPGRIHSQGDRITYPINVPGAGKWDVWVRYGTDMKAYNQPGVSGNHTLAVDTAAPVALQNLPNTGSWASTRWSKTASLDLTSGRHTLTWTNEKGGGISLDAYVLTLDRAFTPTMSPPPMSGPDQIVFQAEDCETFVTKEGELPGGDRPAVWLSGDAASLTDVTILGTPQVNIGLALRSPEPIGWVSGIAVSNVKVADIDGKQAENSAIQAHNVLRTRVEGCELWGRTPIFLSGARQFEFQRNKLVSATRFGGNSEAAILGRTEPIEECIFENNSVVSPPGAQAGGPTARRLLWFSTGHGSVTHNWISGNSAGQPDPSAPTNLGQGRFGGVAGTDQNVGETILFEGNHRTAYFGPLATGAVTSVTLPRTLPRTPDNLLGSVDRKQLAYDPAGNEIPFWPPDHDDGTEEPPIGEYYVTVFAGPGHGQTRRVVHRIGETLQVDHPWTVPPQAGSIVAVGTAFFQNLIVGNETPDGMTGIQLWISCIENVVAGNTIARQRKPGIFLYANGTTLASSMPRTWNRGISPLFWNLAEGNRTEECSAGALVTSGDEGPLPIEFPRALGNVLRHNTFTRNRTDGVILSSRPTPTGLKDTSASVVGTLVEFNVVRDAGIAYHAAASVDATFFRRNHAYFWYPVNSSPDRPIAFQVDPALSTTVLELNSIEGIHGVHDSSLIDLKTGTGVRELPEPGRVVLP